MSRGNPNIANEGVEYRFRPGNVRRKRNGVKQEVTNEMDVALSLALKEALDVILNPRNKYYEEHRIHMIETVIKYCAPKRKEVALDGAGGLLGFDPTKFFNPEMTPEPPVEAEYTELQSKAVPVKAKLNGNGNGNGNGRYDDDEEDD